MVEQSQSLRNQSPQLHSGPFPLAVIIGMPGAGKTRVGREAARLLAVGFTDADQVFEEDLNMSISEFFTLYGQAAFRRQEARIVLELLERSRGILALGGGAPMTQSVAHALERYMDRGGRLVYLQSDPTETVERAGRSGARPMLKGDSKSHWRKLYKQRHPVYFTLSNIRVRTYGSTPQKAARKLVDAIMQERVHISTEGMRPYDVCIGEDCLNELPAVLGTGPVKVALIHTATVQRHSDRARALLRQMDYEVCDILIPDAEEGKTLDVSKALWQRLAMEGFTRSDAVVGLGGGAATDQAGFVASTWMRGITVVNCPTSLLAMVDASTGGKTGINLPQGKNLVGSFYPPFGVLADLKTLQTLPREIFIEGLGEVAKSGLIMDLDLLKLLDRQSTSLRAFDGHDFLGTDLEGVVVKLIERTVKVKAYHVSNDLRETGLREFLNYGHTLAHAIEQLEHFRWRHGNAVAVGCVFAAELSGLLGYLDQNEIDYHRHLLSSLGLPVSWHYSDWSQVLALMHHDKKARGNTLRFIILEEIGHPIHVNDPPLDLLEEAFRRIQPPRP